MKVLVAMDGSKYGRWALNWIARLPFVEPPRVTALHVVDIAALRAPFLAQPVMAGTERYVREEIQRMERRSTKVLEKTTQQLASLNLNGTAKTEQGEVASVLLNRAPRRNGLLVVGSQGLDALDRIMLGSVSTKLIHHAICPVLVVKGEAMPVRRVVVAIDGSNASAKALDFVLARFRPDRSTGEDGSVPIHVSVVHVMPFKYPGSKEVASGRRLLEQSMQRLIKAGFTAETMHPIGKPAEVIMKVASTCQADLIVIGARGLGTVARFLLGSVSTRVVQHANCTVLVVR